MSDSDSNCLACSRVMPDNSVWTGHEYFKESNTNIHTASPSGVEYSREVIHFRTEIDDLKDKLLKIKTTDLQHILNFLVKERDDLLILFAMSKEIFTMDTPHFKEFKNWIHDNRVIHLPSILKEAVQQIEDAAKQSGTESEE
jgi:hypothetical protein